MRRPCRIADGKLAHSIELQGKDIPTEEPAETGGAGPLKLVPNGVSFLMTRLEFPQPKAPDAKEKAKEPEKKAKATRLIGKGKDWMVNAVPLAPRGEGTSSDGRVVVMHTSLATGEMTTLVSSRPAKLAFARLYQIPFVEVRVAGVCADDERVHVLDWEGRGHLVSTDGAGNNFAPFVKTETFRLLSFRTTDAALIRTITLGGDFREFPVFHPESIDTTGPGLLTLHPDGVSCLGARFGTPE